MTSDKMVKVDFVYHGEHMKANVPKAYLTNTTEGQIMSDAIMYKVPGIDIKEQFEAELKKAQAEEKEATEKQKAVGENVCLSGQIHSARRKVAAMELQLKYLEVDKEYVFTAFQLYELFEKSNQEVSDPQAESRGY